MIVSARLNIKVPINELREEVARTLDQAWQNHYKPSDFTGSWTVIALRAPGGNAAMPYADAGNLGSFQDTPLLGKLPAMQRFLAGLPAGLRAVRLLNLAPGSAVNTHRDYELAFERGEMRLHIPIFTNDRVRFTLKGSPLFMNTGECWYINANLPHSVSNEGDSDRVHLVIDCEVNEWLEHCMQTAASVSTAPEYDQQTLAHMIQALDNQDTPAARQLAADLRLQLHDKPDSASLLKEWIPYRLLGAGRPSCQWLYTASVPFTDPFFSETVSKCLKYQPGTGLKVETSLDVLTEWAPELDCVQPAGVIFHVSRCGSTLLSQLLGLDPENIVLAEVPFLDALLRAGKSMQRAEAVALLQAAVAFYGQRRSGREKRVFIKTDSWHIHFAAIFREAFPDVPFFLVYRRPDEVLRSHQKLRGMQAVPGVVPDELLGIDPGTDRTSNLDLHMATVLEAYHRAFLSLVHLDKKVTLLNYHDGPELLLNSLLSVTRVCPRAEYLEKVRQRSRYNAKFPDRPFAAEQLMETASGLLEKAFNGYHELERLRAAAVPQE
ncbi:hypothetical protein C7T94_18405 [Pedobacter yulinensis]|uniref:Aspartyl/asparaginy/proline hydroxylase domain-containing protein n=1 Tax=Pedobacter yulinensis TaxID=2126353 RepID=A0A2T3HHC2_9SPHI|nr:aspartyl/asparaginyl beta-hydroxylase domain-containing protein [Pedobacter yulinensis]PST81839.1 hypothetical protein C7T94_18405 [Pedobacter yulinensis]